MQDPVCQPWVTPAAVPGGAASHQSLSTHELADEVPAPVSSLCTDTQEHDNFPGALTQHLQCNTNKIVMNTPEEGNSLMPAVPSLNPWLMKHHKQLEMLD